MRRQPEDDSMAEISDKAVIAATGKPLSEWIVVLDALGAAQIPHKAIATLLHRDHNVDRWWSQMLTVEYERAIGRREVGQRCDGAYSASASKTIAGTMDDALAAWQRLVAGKTEFDGVRTTGEPRISHTEKWRYWRTDLADGSRLAIDISSKPGGKAVLAINHEKIADAEAAAGWKTFWREFVKPLG